MGSYGKAAFFGIKNNAQLAGMMREVASGEIQFQPVKEESIAPPFSHNWDELWKILLSAEARG